MRNVYVILTGICLILLCTTCKQFTADIDEYLSYWSTEVIAKDYSIDKTPLPNAAGELCVPSAGDVKVTVKLRNPKNFRLVTPTSSVNAGKIISFPGLSTQPQYGTDYTLTQSANDTLILTYKQAFLQAHEWGSGNIGSEITLTSADGRVFGQKFSLNLKADTPPALEYKGVGKTLADGKWHYVLIFQAQNMNDTLPSPLSHLHGDIKTLHITKESGESSVYTIQNVNAAAKTFNWKPGDPLLTTATQLDSSDYDAPPPPPASLPGGYG